MHGVGLIPTKMQRLSDLSVGLTWCLFCRCLRARAVCRNLRIASVMRWLRPWVRLWAAWWWTDKSSRALLWKNVLEMDFQKGKLKSLPKILMLDVTTTKLNPKHLRACECMYGFWIGGPHALIISYGLYKKEQTLKRKNSTSLSTLKTSGKLH